MMTSVEQILLTAPNNRVEWILNLSGKKRRKIAHPHSHELFSGIKGYQLAFPGVGLFHVGILAVGIFVVEDIQGLGIFVVSGFGLRRHFGRVGISVSEIRVSGFVY